MFSRAIFFRASKPYLVL